MKYETKEAFEAANAFGTGEPNTAYARFFQGDSFLNPLTDPKSGLFAANVTFAPGCRNNWHIHHAAKGGGQLLLCTAGEGWYQEESHMAVKQTAGRDALGEFAPKFAELNDDVLFGQVWSREDKLSLRDRSLVTVVALMAQGLTDESFRYHLLSAKKNGITREEIAEIVTHAAFYCGWPKAWAVFRMAKGIWTEEDAK